MNRHLLHLGEGQRRLLGAIRFCEGGTFQPPVVLHGDVQLEFGLADAGQGAGELVGRGHVRKIRSASRAVVLSRLGA